MVERDRVVCEVTPAVQLPKFPGREPKELTRRHGVIYAQRALKQIDQEFPSLEDRAGALRWAIEEMSRVRDALARAAGDDDSASGAPFFLGVLGGLNSAEIDLKQHRAKIQELKTQAAQCRQKAERERERLLMLAEKLEATAERELNYETADKRFA